VEQKAAAVASGAIFHLDGEHYGGEGDWIDSVKSLACTRGATSSFTGSPVKAFAFDSYETSHVRRNGFDIGPGAFPELSIEVEFWPFSTVTATY
jgi:hypothetical protein